MPAVTMLPRVRVELWMEHAENAGNGWPCERFRCTVFRLLNQPGERIAGPSRGAFDNIQKIEAEQQINP